MFCLLFVLVCITGGLEWNVHAAETTSKTHLSTTSGEPSAHLLQGFANQGALTCPRLYTDRGFRGQWSDMCSSNEYPLYEVIFNTNSICVPSGQWWNQQTVWILFEEPQFEGSYVVLSPGDCIRGLKRFLNTVGSILKCAATSSNLVCTFPPRPWRQFVPQSESTITAQARNIAASSRQLGRKKSGRQSSLGQQSGQQQDPQTKFGSGNLDSVKKGGVDWKGRDE
ncbi:hypothetical protein CRM22_005023 [Opisthorchis felineus]|uniref:Interleukin-4 inducing immunoglobulin-binding domain-containing protein n=1 Tax=Opisthorchis felineus TaxID=147828 RepID=A0A4V3SF46_OPIFE|nr:hypothetical protein CRM22_005023 [Opisthorchis felineus]